MFRKLLFIYLLSSYSAFSQASDSTNTSTIDHKDLSGGVWLTSKWKFQNADPMHINEQQKPSHNDPWYPIDLDSVRNISAIIPGFKGAGWFSMNIKKDSSVQHEYLGLTLSQNGASELFIDGKMVSKIGRFSNGKKMAFMPNVLSQLYYIPSDTATTHILIKYENQELIKGKLDRGKYLGLKITRPNASLSAENSKNVYTILYTLLFSTFFIHFILFLFYPKNFSNLYFAIFTLALSILCFKIVGNMSKATTSQFESVFLAFLMVIALIALSALFNYLFGSFKKRFWVISSLVFASLMISRITEFEKDNYVLLFALIVVLAEAIYLTLKARKRNIPDTNILLIGVGVSTVTIAVAGLLALIGGGGLMVALLGLSVLVGAFSILLSITAFLAARIARTNDALSKQLHKVEKLSNEKEHILKTQNDFLEHQVNERTAELRSEKQKSDNLLLNILPQEVAEELKNTGKTEAQHYEEVSVLFTDFVSFTSISQKLGVGELIHELNENFTAFDHIMEKHGLEKIKTIGDAYLAVSGLPNKNHNHANAAVLAAIDILEYVENRKKNSPYGLDIRIGIHSGPLVAGIVGVKKFAFDIWGDTVNTASRMEQNSESGKINVSTGTYTLIQNEFICEPREVISVKGKGDMEMYFVIGKKG